MSQADVEALRQLVATFQTEAIGEGDPNLGFNLLAAMAGTLANLAPTDGTITTRDGRPARLGINLLVTGSASAGLVLEEVLTEVGRRQTNFRRHLQSYVALIDQQQGKMGATLPPMGPKSSGAEDSFAETQQELDGLFNTRLEAWSRILREAPAEQLPQLVARARFLVSVAQAGELNVQLRRLRPGQALIHAGCTSPKDLVSLSAHGAAIIEGRYPLGDTGEVVRGNFLITDPLGMLQKAAKEPDEKSVWLGHFLWLCDGEAGPEAPVARKASDQPETTTERFRKALDSVLARRMNLPKKEPIQLALDTRKAKVRFRGFLAEMEPRLPGISMAARNLIDTLAFGLGQMASIEQRLPLSLDGVEALACFLVRRMGNARTMMLHAGAVSRRRWQIERVFRKLEQGPTEPRKIYRNLSLLASDCDECLRWMEEAGIARRVNRKWELQEGARLRFEDCTIPLLDV